MMMTEQRVPIGALILYVGNDINVSQTGTVLEYLPKDPTIPFSFPQYRVAWHEMNVISLQGDVFVEEWYHAFLNAEKTSYSNAMVSMSDKRSKLVTWYALSI